MKFESMYQAIENLQKIANELEFSSGNVYRLHQYVQYLETEIERLADENAELHDFLTELTGIEDYDKVSVGQFSDWKEKLQS